MKKVLIVLANIENGGSKGELNKLIANETKNILEKWDYVVTINEFKNGYNPHDEVNKILENDFIIFQYPIWWFNVPWHLKKWIDDVFMAGYDKLWKNDGRVLGYNSKKYGSGGLLSNKKYMLSVTMNAPKESFSNNQFLSMGLENLLSNMNKTCEFIGLEPLVMRNFMVNDVVKNPKIDDYIDDLKNVLEKNFK